MSTGELPERKEEAVRHLRNAAFVVCEGDGFPLLSYTFCSYVRTSGHSPPSSLLLADLFLSGLWLFFFRCNFSDFSSVGVQFSVAFALNLLHVLQD